MIDTRTAGSNAATRRAQIDAAIHNDLPSTRALFPYLPEHWV